MKNITFIAVLLAFQINIFHAMDNPECDKLLQKQQSNLNIALTELVTTRLKQEITQEEYEKARVNITKNMEKLKKEKAEEIQSYGAQNSSHCTNPDLLSVCWEKLERIFESLDDIENTLEIEKSKLKQS